MQQNLYYPTFYFQDNQFYKNFSILPDLYALFPTFIIMYNTDQMKPKHLDVSH